MIPSSKVIREQKQAVAAAIKRGTIDCIYGVPGGGGNVGIANADLVFVNGVRENRASAIKRVMRAPRP
jgi:hypothetical protein